MNRRIVILGDDEYLSDEFDWSIVKTLRAKGVKVEIVFTDDQGMTTGGDAALH